MRVPSLYQFFRRQLQYGFGQHGMAEPATVDYVSDMLARFAHTHALYLIRNADGLPLESIAGMLAEWRAAQGGMDAPRDRARATLVVRHIGEYTLFMSGLFRERVRARGQPLLPGARQQRVSLLRRARTSPAAHCSSALHADFRRTSGALRCTRRRQFPAASASSPLAARWQIKGAASANDGQAAGDIDRGERFIW